MAIQSRLRAVAVAMGIVAIQGVLATSAVAQAFPGKPVELVVPYPAGGSTDALARAFADASRTHASQPIVVMNKPGAGGSIAANEVINAKPDGYKIGIFTNDVLTIPLLGLAKFSHTDLEPIVQLNYDPVILVVRSDSPWKSMADFLAAAKSAKGVQIGTTGNGTLSHLGVEALADKAAVKLPTIPYQGASPAILSLLGGHIEAVAVSPPEVVSYVQAGTLRTLVSLADKRTKSTPDVPTAKELGLDLSVGSFRYLAVSSKTPAPVVAQLRQIASDTAKDPAFVASLDKLNIGYAFTDGADFRGVVEKEYGVMKTLIEKVGMKP